MRWSGWAYRNPADVEPSRDWLSLTRLRGLAFVVVFGYVGPLVALWVG